MVWNDFVNVKWLGIDKNNPTFVLFSTPLLRTSESAVLKWSQLFTADNISVSKNEFVYGAHPLCLFQSQQKRPDLTLFAQGIRICFESVHRIWRLKLNSLRDKTNQISL